MGRPMSAANQEILEIVRQHGPIALNDIVPRVTLLSERVDIAGALFNLKASGKLLRNKDKTYVVNGKNGSANDATVKCGDDMIPTELLDQFSPAARKAVKETGQLPEMDATPPSEPPAPTPSTTADAIDVIEGVLQLAADSAQKSLDAFIAEVGDLAEILSALVDSRDRADDALAAYRRSKA